MFSNFIANKLLQNDDRRLCGQWTKSYSFSSQFSRFLLRHWSSMLFNALIMI